MYTIFTFAQKTCGQGSVDYGKPFLSMTPSRALDFNKIARDAQGYPFNAATFHRRVVASYLLFPSFAIAGNVINYELFNGDFFRER